jgi:hypothetical protein
MTLFKQYPQDVRYRRFQGPWYPRISNDLLGLLIEADAAKIDVVMLIKRASLRVDGFSGAPTFVVTGDDYIWLCGPRFKRRASGVRFTLGCGMVTVLIPPFATANGHRTTRDG